MTLRQNAGSPWMRIPELVAESLRKLDRIERLAVSDIASCCGCSFYWEYHLEPREWGFCRRKAPKMHRAGEMAESKPYACPAVDYDWYCGEFVQGCHPAVVAQRAVWRQALERARETANG